jgi:ABC-type transport system substrate-binding protein
MESAPHGAQSGSRDWRHAVDLVSASIPQALGAEDGQPKHGGILRVRGFDPPHFGDPKQPESAIGTGPFILERYEPNVKTVFTRNPTYFRPGQPYVDRVEWVVIDDASTGLAMYRAGQLDCGPMEWWVVRQPDLEALQKSHPHLRYQVASPAGV